MALDERDTDERDTIGDASNGSESPRKGRARERHQRRQKRGETAPRSSNGGSGETPSAASSGVTALFGRLKAAVPGGKPAEAVPEDQTESAAQPSPSPAPDVTPFLPVDEKGEIDFLKLVPPDLSRVTDSADTEDSLTTPLNPPTSELEARRARVRQRRQQLAMATTPKSRSQQAAVAGRRPRLPDLSHIDFSHARTLAYIAAAAALVVGVIMGLALLKDDPLIASTNAIWLGTEWAHGQKTTDQMALLVGKLRQNRIGTVYARISWLKDDTTWAGGVEQGSIFEEVRPQVEQFVADFRVMYPDALLYGWIDFPVDRGPQGYRLNDPLSLSVVADFSAQIVKELGFDGVFLNALPVWERNSEDYVSLLQQVKFAMGDAGPLAVAIPPDWSPSAADVPKSPGYAPNTEWSKRFKQRVALLTDQLVLYPFESGLSERLDYIDWVAYQVSSYAEAVGDLDAAARLMIGVPTYDSAPPAHNAAVENIPATLDGINKGLEQAGSASAAVEGIALFAEWTTDDIEWRLFEQLWVQ